MSFELIDHLIENAVGGDFDDPNLTGLEEEEAREALKEWFTLLEEEGGDMENDADDSLEDGEEKDDLEDDDEDKEAKTEALKEWFALLEEEMENDADDSLEDGEEKDDLEDDDEEAKEKKEELKEYFNIIEEAIDAEIEDEMPENNSHEEDWNEDSDNEPLADDGEGAEAAADLIGTGVMKDAMNEWYNSTAEGILESIEEELEEDE